MAFRPALIVVDMQNDFCPPTGSLAVAGARDLAPKINELLSLPGFVFKVATQDFHPTGHISFATNHPPPDNTPFESFVDMKNVVGGRPEETMKQRLWPVHCVQGTKGADIIEEIDKDKIDLIIQKGMDERVEMYSAFSDSFGNLTSGKGGVSHDLATILHEKGISDVYVCGVAGDYCVKATAVDAAKEHFNSYVVEDCQGCVDPAQGWEDSKRDFQQNSVKLVNSHGPEVGRVRGLSS